MTGQVNSLRVHLQVLLEHSKDVKLDDLEVTKDFLAIFYRAHGLQVM